MCTELFSRWDSKGASSAFDAIVIGSGMGGLGTAAILARHGKRVLVLERHWRPGGLTHTFRRGPYEWDVGLHYLGKVHDQKHPLRMLFDGLTEGALHWSHTGPIYDRVVFPDARFEFATPEDALARALEEAFPAERAAIAGYLALLHRVEARSERYFLQRMLPKWVNALAAPLLAWPFARFASTSTFATLSELTKDRRLIGLLTARWGNYGLPPKRSSFAMHALASEYYLGGGSYPSGGASQLFNALAPGILKAGGQVRILAEVDRIELHKGKAVGVRLQNGDVLRAKVVVSSIGWRETIESLLPPEHRPEGFDADAKTLQPSAGHLALYLGFDRPSDELGLQPANTWVCADYDHDAALARYEADPAQPFPVVFMDSATAKDPQRKDAPATVTAVTPAPYAWFEKWSGSKWKKRGAEYDDFKAGFTERLTAAVLEQFPLAKGHVAHRELSTPLTMVAMAKHARGGIYGLEPSVERFCHGGLGVYGPVGNLFLAGQDVVTGGVGAALMSSVLVSSAILRRNASRLPRLTQAALS